MSGEKERYTKNVNMMKSEERKSYYGITLNVPISVLLYTLPIDSVFLDCKKSAKYIIRMYIDAEGGQRVEPHLKLMSASVARAKGIRVDFHYLLHARQYYRFFGSIKFFKFIEKVIDCR